MKILLIHNKYGKFSGEEAVVESQLKLLHENGHEVLTYYRSSEEIDTMKNGKMKAFISAFSNPRSTNDISTIIRNNKPDIVHIHNLYPFISPSFLPRIKKEFNIPIVMTVHNYRLLCPNGLFFQNEQICEKCTSGLREINCVTNNCEDNLLKSIGYASRNFWARSRNYYKDNVDVFLCLTSFQKEKLIKNGFKQSKCKTLPNFYNKEIINIKKDYTKANYIAFAGRISPEKGIKVLLKAAELLPNIHFKLAGNKRDGYLDSFSIPSNVTFVGMLNSKELEQFYLNARIYVHPSICYEGFPMVFPEAMSYKLPILVPNIGSYPEIIENKNHGLVFENNKPESLATTINSIWNDIPSLEKYGHKGFLKLLELYSKNIYTNKLLTIYNSLIDE